jgi:hypothetical protein
MAPNDRDYAQVAERYLAAAQHGGPSHEAIGFDGYHAVESICCSWIAHMNQVPPQRHQAKLNNFARLARHAPFGWGAAQVVIAFNAVRNRFLYPVQAIGGRTTLPQNFMPQTDVDRLVRRAASLIRTITPQL